MVFAFEDDYSFGVVASSPHIAWYLAKCSTMKADPRYTTSSIWDTFPWPQSPSQKQVEAVAFAAQALRAARNRAMQDHRMSLRDLYRQMELPGKNVIKDLHAELDRAVLEAYGFDPHMDLLAQILHLNGEVATKEASRQRVQKPGLPTKIKNREKLVSDDCVKYLS
jgi:hypothetical protein